MSDKCIYRKKIQSHQIIKTSKTTMAYYMRKLLDLSTWMMNPAHPIPISTIAEANTFSSQNFKTKKSTRILNIMMAERERSVPAPPTETQTQVQVTTPPPSPPTATHATIETQTIENPQLLAYTDEQLIGHYTHQLFQCEPAAATSATSSLTHIAPTTPTTPEDQTLTCSVCLEILNSGDKNTTLTPCGHAYHLSCLLTSLRNKNLCPMCRGSLEDPRPKPSTTNTLLPSNAEQIIRDELYWFPKSAHILNIRGSNHPKRAFKDSLRTFAYAVLQTTAEFVHAENVPDEWYSEDETEDETEDEDEDDDNTENSENIDNIDNDENEQNAETDDNDENHTDEETGNLNPRQEYHIDEQHVRTRGVNIPRINMRLRSSSRRGGGDFDLRNELP